MKHKILWIGVIVLPTLLASAWAADIFGTWIVRGLSMRGMGETVFNFKADGTILTGTVSDPQGETAISEGRISGDEISFVVIRKSFGKEVKFAYKGKVALNEIQFTLEIEGVAMQPQEFIAKREFQRHNDYIPRRIAVPVGPSPRF